MHAIRNFFKDSAVETLKSYAASLHLSVLPVFTETTSATAEKFDLLIDAVLLTKYVLCSLGICWSLTLFLNIFK